MMPNKEFDPSRPMFEQIEPEEMVFAAITLAAMLSKIAIKGERYQEVTDVAKMETGDEWVHHDEAALHARNDADIQRYVFQAMSQDLERPVVINPPEHTNYVDIGHTVSLKFDDGETEEYVILGKHDGGYIQGAISMASPLAQAILGKKRGEEVRYSVDGSKTGFHYEVTVKIKAIQSKPFIQK